MGPRCDFRGVGTVLEMAGRVLGRVGAKDSVGAASRTRGDTAGSVC